MNNMKKVLLVTILGLLVFSTLAIALPVDAAGGLVVCDLVDEVDDLGNIINERCTLCHLFIMISGIFTYIFTRIVPVVAVLMVVIGGVMLMTAHTGGLEDLGGGKKGGPAMLNQAKKLFSGVLVGLIIIYGAWLIVSMFLFTIGATQWAGFGNGWWIVDCSTARTQAQRDAQYTPPPAGGGAPIDSNLWNTLSASEQNDFVNQAKFINKAEERLLSKGNWSLTSTGDILLIFPDDAYYKFSVGEFNQLDEFTGARTRAMAKSAAKNVTQESEIDLSGFNIPLDLAISEIIQSILGKTIQDAGSLASENIINSNMGSIKEILDLPTADQTPALPPPPPFSPPSAAEIAGKLIICDLMLDQLQKRDLCYSDVAVEVQNTSVCDVIPDKNTKDSCYSRVAIKLKDPSICDKIINNIIIKDTCLQSSS